MALNYAKFLWGLLVLAILVGIAYGVAYYSKENAPYPESATTTPSEEVAATTSTARPLPSSQIIKSETTLTFHLYEEKIINGVTFKPWAVLEDSRCASDVQCVWAGRVKVALNLSGGGESGAGIEIEPNQTINTKNFRVTLVDVKPYPVSTHKTQDDEYQIILKIEPIKINTGCYIGGCSGQICSDNPNAVSTCEYRAVYACYKNAKCERQGDGRCGWTETSAYKSCVANNNNLIK